MRSKFPRLTHLLLNSANSSNWLKYRTSDSIRELTLYYEKGHNETQDRQHEPNPKNIRKLSTIVSGSPKVFSLTHLHDFKNLLKLLLDGYHFNWSDEDAVSCPSLTSLTLINCTWEYPFTLAQFSHGGNLSYIALTYNQNHPFILLERFNKFLETPSLGIGASAEYLRLSFEDYSDSTWRKLFLAKQLDKFSATEFPRLRELELYGIQMNLENYKQYVNLIQNNFNLHSLKLSIWEILKEDPPSERCTQREITRGERYVNLFKNLLQERVNIKVGIRLI